MANAHIGAWLTRMVGTILVLTTVLMLFSVGQELANGVTLSTNKWGPRTTYARVSDPFKYWASVTSHTVVALGIGTSSVGAFWLARLESQGTAPQKNRKSRK